MKLGLRIFLFYLAVLAACLFFTTDWIWTTLRTRYMESVEEPLVDTANLLASVAEQEMARPDFTFADLEAPLARAHARRLSTHIYDLKKSAVDLHLYITDVSGKVVFDTRRPSAVGADYSRFHDVKLTLEGKYGARATLRDPKDSFSTSLYVAAPIYRNGRVNGVLTVVEPTASIDAFLELARPAFIRAGLLAIGVAALLSLALSYLLTRPIDRLALYADGIRLGKRPPFPELGRTEIADLGLALRRMQEALEGRQYAEEYVQTLTHELKSPLSAIRGAAELLEEGMPPQQQARFIANIRQEAERIARIVERMLELAKLENRRETPEMEPVELDVLVRTVAESAEPLLAGKDLKMEIAAAGRLTVSGNAFLLHQALENLVQNAIEFSPRGGTVRVTMTPEQDRVTISVTDEGPGIPAYALDRIFERFYSLGRPDNGRKSTGLGLNLVREVATSHGGTIRVANRPEGGALAELSLPRSQACQAHRQIS
ncbi:MAG TPA: two-component system sensor histidine kinase CreC [Thermoanaerobaculia bacterium]|jgi:two-component system sensor histidine kinase CreC|nr:two-component system sensor histidine kinase CreC [Thermoanaerobaculia bacterium]